jgi:hypothetical protein
MPTLSTPGRHRLAGSVLATSMAESGKLEGKKVANFQLKVTVSEIHPDKLNNSITDASQHCDLHPLKTDNIPISHLMSI